MGCRIIYDKGEGRAVMYCSVSERAFGPCFRDDPRDPTGEICHSGADRADAFMRWLRQDAMWQQYDKYPLDPDPQHPDARQLTLAGLEQAYADWAKQEAEQWEREESETWENGEFADWRTR